MEMIQRLVQAELKRQESPQVMTFIGDEERELFGPHQDKVQVFQDSADGCDAWGLLVEAFRAFVELPDGLDEE